MSRYMPSSLVQYTIFFLLLWASLPSYTQPPTEPQLRLNTEMHTARILRIDMDANGRNLLTVSDDKTAKLWDLRGGALIRTFRVPMGAGNEGKLYAGALSPDGKTVALGGFTSRDGLNTSVYFFDANSGQLIDRIAGFEDVIFDLEYSLDGRYLGVSLGGKNGIRIYRSSNRALVAEDREYGDDSYNLAWDQSGRFATVSYDGYVRLYGEDFSLIRKAKLSGGNRPYRIAISSDGSLLAVGFDDSPKLQVLDGQSLSIQYEPEIRDFNNEFKAIFGVTFSRDGRYLAAGGTFMRYENGNWWYRIRVWDQAGRGAYKDGTAGGNSIIDLKALPDGGWVFGGAVPDWGKIDVSGLERTHYRVAALNDYAAKDISHFKLGPNGGELGVKPYGKPALSFSIRNRQLTEKSSLHRSYTDETADIIISNWANTFDPRLNGTSLEVLESYERSRSVDIVQDRVVLGADWYIYGLDKTGDLLWETPVPGVAWALKIAARRQVMAAALDDGTIRWYRLSDGEPLLSLFLHPDGRWLLWTPSGYYDASPGAEDLIGWHVNQGADGTPLFYPASKFRHLYYRPDVIDLILETLDEAEAVKQADAALPFRPTLRDITQQLPPEVSILSPASGTRVRSQKVEIEYTVNSPNQEAVTGLRVSVDGRPTSQERGFTQPAGGKRKITVDIPAKDCIVSIQAENRFGMSEPASVRLNWAGSPARPANVDIRPNLYVLAIGVSDYEHEDMNDLTFAAKDARDFGEAVKTFEGGLYRNVEVHLLTEEEASKDNILDELEWLQKRPTSRDVAMLFFAGHGVDDNSRNFFYLPYDANPERLRRYGISKEEVQITIRSVPSKILVFMDACHSGGMARVEGIARRDLGPDINAVVNELITAENGAVVFSSSTSRQYSLEDIRWNNGAFTKALVEGLRGAARVQGSQKITVKALDAYIAQRVNELTGGEQDPTTNYPPNVPDFPIGIVD